MATSPSINELIPLRTLTQIPSRKPIQIQSSLTSVSNLTPGSDLTRKQKLFVEYWLTGLSDKEAALKAGYALSTAESACITVRKHPAVQREIRRRLSQHYKDFELTTDEIIESVRRLSDANLRDYVDLQEDGGFKVNLNKVTREMWDAVEELSMDAYGRPKVRLVSKLAAREMLARFKKMYSEAGKQSGEGASFTIESLDKLVKNYTQNVTVNQTINQVSVQEQKFPPQIVEGRVIEASRQDA
jgi:phage terminase small subunit